jgi:hypothetical protein
LGGPFFGGRGGIFQGYLSAFFFFFFFSDPDPDTDLNADPDPWRWLTVATKMQV